MAGVWAAVGRDQGYGRDVEVERCWWGLRVDWKGLGMRGNWADVSVVVVKIEGP